MDWLGQCSPNFVILVLELDTKDHSVLIDALVIILIVSLKMPASL